MIDAINGSDPQRRPLTPATYRARNNKFWRKFSRGRYPGTSGEYAHMNTMVCRMPWRMPWRIPCACLGACHDCVCHGGLSSDVLGAAAGGAHRMLFRIPLRIPFACHSMACASCARHCACHGVYYGPYYSPYYGACQCAYKYVCYRVYNGPIRLIFKLLIIYRVTKPTESTNSKYYLLIGPYPDP